MCPVTFYFCCDSDTQSDYYDSEVSTVGNIGDLEVGICFVSYGGGVNIVGNIGDLVVGINLINRTY